jgi:phosphatidylserine decarboxylase
MIKFGSRTEIYLPAGAEFDIKVNVGDKVAAGSTILGELK